MENSFLRTYILLVLFFSIFGLVQSILSIFGITTSLLNFFVMLFGLLFIFLHVVALVVFLISKEEKHSYLMPLFALGGIFVFSVGGFFAVIKIPSIDWYQLAFPLLSIIYFLALLLLSLFELRSKKNITG